jgi:putative peptidoglycan lipid II flippase
MGLKGGLSRAVGGVAVVTVAGQLLNVAQEMVIAAKFGTSTSTDAYKMALVIPTMLALELATIVGAIVIPVFHEQRKSLTPSEIFSVGLNFMGTVAFVVAGTVCVFAPYLMDAVAGGFSQETRQMATFLLRVLSLGIFLTLISLFLSNVLNANKYFILPAFQRMFLYAGTLTFLILIGHSLGIAAAAFGFVIGIGLFVIVQMIVILRQTSYSFTLNPGHPVIKSMVLLAAPLIFYSFLNQLNVLIEKRIVSGFEPGSLSALDFAFKLSAFFINFLVVGINTVLFPTLSESFTTDNRQRISSIFSMLMKGLAAIIAPTTMAFILLGKPLVHLVFERGSFDARSTMLTSQALTFYAIGLTGQACVSSLPRFYQAFRKNSSLLKMGVVVIIFNVCAMLLLSHEFGFIGVAAATSLTSTLFSFLLFFNLRSKVIMDLWELSRTIVKICVATIGFSIVVVYSYQYMNHLALFSGLLENILELAIPVIFGGLVYIFLCKAMKVDVVQMMIEQIMHFAARGVVK